MAVSDPSDPPPAPLRRALRLTRWSLRVEVALRAFWPLATLAGLLAAAVAFGAPLTPRLIWALAGGLALAALWGLTRLRRVTPAMAAARLDATLPGRPLAGLRDRPAMAVEAPVTAALWSAHRARLAAVAATARPVRPAPDLAPRDPLALRLVALTALGMAAVFGDPARLMALHWPTTPVAPAAWEGWATPPAYTGKPLIYLNNLDSDTLVLPQASRLTFRLYGPGLALTQTIGTPEDTTADQPAVTARHSGQVAIRGTGLALDVTVLPDTPPAVRAEGVAERRPDGRLAQDFAASDDHGIAAGQAQIALDLPAVDRRHGLTPDPDPLAPLVIDLPLPAARERADFTATLLHDASAHPLANLPVVLTLSVTDGLGQSAAAAPLHLTLPGRRFFDPLAAALIEQRRDLVWSATNARRVAQVLRALTDRPEGFLSDAAVYLPLRSAIRRVEADLAAGALTPATRDEVAAVLWDAAVQLEDGGLSDALAAMERAQERLSEAIRRGATETEIQKLIGDLRQATDDYTRMLAQRGEAPDPAERFARQPQGQPITGDQIAQMMDQIETLMRDGRMAEAQALLDQFGRMMQNLRVTQGEGGGGGGGAGSGPADRLGDTLRRQQDLADESFRRLQDSYRSLGQQQAPGGAADDLADRQRDLRRDLGQQRGLLPRTGTPEGDAARQRLDQAGRAMEEAEQALRGDDPGLAVDRQAEALEALREGMRQMAQGAEDRTGDSGAQGRAHDPLGRRVGRDGSITTPEGALDGTTGSGRARALMDEIRRRSGEQARPEAERDYLRRLLEMF